MCKGNQHTSLTLEKMITKLKFSKTTFAHALHLLGSAMIKSRKSNFGTRGSKSSSRFATKVFEKGSPFYSHWFS